MRAPAGWYTLVWFGACPGAPGGAYRSYERCVDALSRWRERMGCEAGSYEAATSLRIVGPYATRALARAADISDATAVPVAYDYEEE